MKKTTIVTLIIVILVMIPISLGIYFLANTMEEQQQTEQEVQVRIDMVTHLMEHIDLYEEELKALGYTYERLYTLEDTYNWNYTAWWWEEDDAPSSIEDDDLTERVGHQERGMIRVETDHCSYLFDVGLETINIKLTPDVYVTVAKSGTEEKLVDLEEDGYPMYVSVSAPEFREQEYGYNPFNRYNMSFTRFREVYDDEQLDDIKIKDYISSAELTALLKEGLALEATLLTLYQEKMNGTVAEDADRTPEKGEKSVDILVECS